MRITVKELAKIVGDDMSLDRKEGRWGRFDNGKRVGENRSRGRCVIRSQRRKVGCRR